MAATNTTSNTQTVFVNGMASAVVVSVLEDSSPLGSSPLPLRVLFPITRPIKDATAFPSAFFPLVFVVICFTVVLRRGVANN